MIRVKNLNKQYNKGKSNSIHVLKNITLEINDGEMVAFVGKSGAGKSTLMHILACMDTYDGGEYYLDNQLVRNLEDKKMARIRNEKIGIVIQDFALIEDFTALENVSLPLEIGKKYKKRIKKEMSLKVLEEVGMIDASEQIVRSMSGGEKQRVAIARALINRPDIVIADEPTGALDSVNSKNVMELFETLNKKGMTVIIVTHDMQIASQCKRKIEICDGKIEEEGKKSSWQSVSNEI